MVALFCATQNTGRAESDPEVSREILGIRLGMTKGEADARLREIGKLLRVERQRQEVWDVRDPNYSHVVIGFEKDGELRFVTAIAREGSEAKRVRYDAVGPLSAAKQAGKPELKNFYFQWELPAKERGPQALVSARGTDAEFLQILSIKRTGEDPEKSKADDDDD